MKTSRTRTTRPSDPAGTAVCMVLAPYVLEQMALNGGTDVREAALTTLMTDTSLRSARVALGGELLATAGRVDASAVSLPYRLISDAHNTQHLPGDPVREEGDPPSGDVAVDEAYDGLGGMAEFVAEAYYRDSIDGAGMDLLGTTHFGTRYDNAFWDGTQMVFGDGDGQYFNRFTIALDVIGHELMHGVTEREAGLVYLSQPGALNESVSDVFGSLLKQWTLQQKAEDADWLIGEGLFTDDVQGVALRSMKAPGTAYDDPVLGKDPQPAHMDDYVFTTADNGGVHINSGIPNHAFYELATTLGGYAWEDAGLIWYSALTSPRLRPHAEFQSFARLTYRVSGRLFGQGSDQTDAVRAAWSEVGIQVGPNVRPVQHLGPVALTAGGSGGGARQDRAPWRAARPRPRRGAAKRAPAKKAATKKSAPAARRASRGGSGGGR